MVSKQRSQWKRAAYRARKKACQHAESTQAAGTAAKAPGSDTPPVANNKRKRRFAAKVEGLGQKIAHMQEQMQGWGKMQQNINKQHVALIDKIGNDLWDRVNKMQGSIEEIQKAGRGAWQSGFVEELDDSEIEEDEESDKKLAEEKTGSAVKFSSR